MTRERSPWRSRSVWDPARYRDLVFGRRRYTRSSPRRFVVYRTQTKYEKVLVSGPSGQRLEWRVTRNPFDRPFIPTDLRKSVWRHEISLFHDNITRPYQYWPRPQSISSLIRIVNHDRRPKPSKCCISRHTRCSDPCFVKEMLTFIKQQDVFFIRSRNFYCCPFSRRYENPYEFTCASNAYCTRYTTNLVRLVSSKK